MCMKSCFLGWMFSSSSALLFFFFFLQTDVQRAVRTFCSRFQLPTTVTECSQVTWVSTDNRHVSWVMWSPLRNVFSCSRQDGGGVFFVFFRTSYLHPNTYVKPSVHVTLTPSENLQPKIFIYRKCDCFIWWNYYQSFIIVLKHLKLNPWWKEVLMFQLYLINDWATLATPPWLNLTDYSFVFTLR